MLTLLSNTHNLYWFCCLL